MKKSVSVLLVMLVLVLGGCGRKSDYDNMVNDLGQIKAMQYAMAEVGATVNGVDLNYTMEFDTSTPLFHGNILGVDIYLDSENLYVEALGNWFQTPTTEEMKTEFENEFDANFLTMDMPAGDEIINISSGVDAVDQAVNGKTYDEVVTATETGYTILGLEDVISIDTADNKLTLNFTEGENSIHIAIGKAEKFELPTEATEGKVLDPELVASL